MKATEAEAVASNLHACQIISGRDVERVTKQIDAAIQFARAHDALALRDAVEWLADSWAKQGFDSDGARRDSMRAYVFKLCSDELRAALATIPRSLPARSAGGAPGGRAEGLYANNIDLGRRACAETTSEHLLLVLGGRILDRGREIQGVDALRFIEQMSIEDRSSLIADLLATGRLHVDAARAPASVTVPSVGGKGAT